MLTRLIKIKLDYINKNANYTLKLSSHLLVSSVKLKLLTLTD